MKNSFEQSSTIENESKYGLNVHAVLEFGRHEVPGKTPDGMSADYLEESGKKSAAIRGGGIREKNVAAYSSPKERAQETVDLEVGAAELVSAGAVNVVNRKIEELEGMIPEGAQKEGNQFKVKIKKELDTIVGFQKIFPQAKQWAEKQMTEGSERSLMDLIIQFYLDNSELCEQEGVTTPHEAATQIAYRADIETRMTSKFLNGTDIRLVNITHGPKLEPFLLEVVDEFNSLEDIGDSLDPGENFEFEIQTDASGERNIKLNFRGKTYDINQSKLEMLAKEYRDKLKQEKE